MMKSVEITPERQAAINDFMLTSGYLIAIELDADGLIQECNKGFRLAARPVGDGCGQPLHDLLKSDQGDQVDFVAGLPGGLPIPYRLRTWEGREILVHAYPLPNERILLLGTVSNPDETLAVQRMAGLTTEMGNLVRELGRANRRILELSRTDVLTRLANRRYFFERLGTAVDQARRHQRPLSAIMLDLDHFKQVNDRFGHAGGDAVLKAVSEVLRQNARSSDLPGRLGGEELAVLLPETDLDKGRQAAERFRACIEETRPLGEGHVFTASLGVASLLNGEDSEGLLARADEALYRAKEGGRNRVVTADERPSSQHVAKSALTQHNGPAVN